MKKRWKTLFTETDANELPQPQEEVVEAIAYGSNQEHLLEELQRLNLKLMQLVAKEYGTEIELYASVSKVLGSNSWYSAEEWQTITADSKNLASERIGLDRHIEQRLAASRKQGVYLQLPRLVRKLKLEPFEQYCVVACLAMELDRKYEKVYGLLDSHFTVSGPSVDLLMRIFAPSSQERLAARQVFAPERPFVQMVLEMRGEFADSSIPLYTKRLKLNDWTVSFLLGQETLDERLIRVANLRKKDECDPAAMNPDIAERMGRYLWRRLRQQDQAATAQLLYCSGPEGTEKLGTVEFACRSLDMRVLTVDMDKLLETGADVQEMLRRLGQHAMLWDTALCFEYADCLVHESEKYRLQQRWFFDMLHDFHPFVFVLGETDWHVKLQHSDIDYVQVDFPLPDAADRRAYWEIFSQDFNLTKQVDLTETADRFRFTPQQIHAALRHSRTMALWNGDGEARIGRPELQQACYFQSNRSMASKATRIEPAYSWDMLVLPADPMNQLKEICNQVKYRSTVYGEWGFAKRLSLGKGLNVLFSGPPGTGKTMSAEVIARELGLELYKIDVSQIVSKYIGETEKNLSRIFNDAGSSNAILFFDEADALFGKRSEVKDAHDRYANQEISYLLQKMEEYEGIVVLATNLTQNLDEAFLRRLHFKVEFPFPEQEQRKRIWQGMFPEEVPIAPDMDFDFLAQKLLFAGGSIKNIALNAAFYAAHEACPVGMKQMMLATKREYVKQGKTFVKSDFDPYHKLMEVNAPCQ